MLAEDGAPACDPLPRQIGCQEYESYVHKDYKGCIYLPGVPLRQAKVEALESEKALLEEGTHKARHTMAQMQAELNTIHTEYASTTAALQQVTGGR